MRRFALAALLALSAQLAAAQVAIPPVARVTDLTGTLTPEQRAGLEQRLAAFEQRKGSQIAVLIVPTTAPEELEQYSLRVAEAWKLGRKGVDDGALLLVAKDDRAMRIEVGYGLEGALPDAIAKRIVAETIAPHFRDGDFNGGISAGVDQVLRVIDGEKLPEPRLVTREQGLGASAQFLFFIGIVLLNVVRRAGKSLGEFPAAAGFGGLYGVICGLAAGVFAGLAGALVFTFFALLMLAMRGMGGGGGGAHWGGRSSGGFGGGRSGGGGFSGGGGGFGGGGASGRW